MGVVTADGVSFRFGSSAKVAKRNGAMRVREKVFGSVRWTNTGRYILPLGFQKAPRIGILYRFYPWVMGFFLGLPRLRSGTRGSGTSPEELLKAVMAEE